MGPPNLAPGGCHVVDERKVDATFHATPAAYLPQGLGPDKQGAASQCAARYLVVPQVAANGQVCLLQINELGALADEISTRIRGGKQQVRQVLWAVPVVVVHFGYPLASRPS